MLAAQDLLFGLSIAELAIVAVAVGYVVSLFKDFRPIKALRDEVKGLRQELVDARDDLKQANDRIAELELENGRLEKATDLSTLQRNDLEIAALLKQVADELRELDKSVRGNTAAIEVLTKRRVIDEALRDDRGAAA